MNSKIRKSSQRISGLSGKKKPKQNLYLEGTGKILHLNGRLASDPEVVLCRV